MSLNIVFNDMEKMFQLYQERTFITHEEVSDTVINQYNNGTVIRVKKFPIAFPSKLFMSKNFVFPMECKENVMLTFLTRSNVLDYIKHTQFDEYLKSKNIEDGYLRYAFHFAWAGLISAENRHFWQFNDRGEEEALIFTNDQIRRLPIFTMIDERMELHPYIVHPMCYQNQFARRQNCARFINHSKVGVVSNEIFTKRMNLFITGKENVNIFHGWDFTCTGITGSIMAACMPRYNPLFEMYRPSQKSGKSAHEKFLSFLKHHYANADVDFFCTHPDYAYFLDSVTNVKQCFENNLNDTVNVSINHRVKFYVANNLPHIVQKFEIGLGHVPDREYYYKEYVRMKQARIAQIAPDYKYSILLNIVPFENFTIETTNPRFIRNAACAPNVESALHTGIECDGEGNGVFQYHESIKFTFSNDNMRDVEYYHIRKSAIGHVAQHHLPCVRAYYNGYTCYALPSAITAWMTLTNINYFYAKCTSQVTDIFLKYIDRGYHIILNDIETAVLNQYVTPQHVFLYSSKSYYKPSTVIIPFDEIKPVHLNTEYLMLLRSQKECDVKEFVSTKLIAN